MNYGDITDSIWAWSCACNKDLCEVNDIYEKTKLRRPYDREVEVYSFPQSWPNTGLGFAGNGLTGQAISTAQTTVCVGPNGDAAVYCGKGLLYHIKQYNGKFIDDLRAHNMMQQGKHRIYEKTIPEEKRPEPKADQQGSSQN